MREENIRPDVFCGAREVFVPRDKGLRFPPVRGIRPPAASHQSSWRTGEQSKRGWLLLVKEEADRHSLYKYFWEANIRVGKLGA